MDTLTKLQTIRNFEKWAAAHKIDASPLALLEYLDQNTKAEKQLAAAPVRKALLKVNYDKIQKMTWEEMAAFLAEITTRCFNAGKAPDFRICAACPIYDKITGHCNFERWLMTEVYK